MGEWTIECAVDCKLLDRIRRDTISKGYMGMMRGI